MNLVQLTVIPISRPVRRTHGSGAIPQLGAIVPQRPQTITQPRPCATDAQGLRRDKEEGGSGIGFTRRRKAEMTIISEF